MNKFNVGDKVYVKSIGMTAIILSRIGDQYTIKREDGKNDLVMANGLLARYSQSNHK